jgi:hypothetical protein
MTTQTTRSRRDDQTEVRFVVEGPHGAVEYHASILSGMPLGIEYHSPRPQWDGQEPADCPVTVGPCYGDGTSRGAADLHREYAAAGYDDEVIWRELETRYAAWEAEAGR